MQFNAPLSYLYSMEITILHSVYEQFHLVKSVHAKNRFVSSVSSKKLNFTSSYSSFHFFDLRTITCLMRERVGGGMYQFSCNISVSSYLFFIA